MVIVNPSARHYHKMCLSHNARHADFKHLVSNVMQKLQKRINKMHRWV